MRFSLFTCVAVYALLLSLPLRAQSPNGNINGQVVDASNSAITGADIVAANDVTGVQYSTKTNEEGLYVLPNLPPGPYRLQVSKVGFKTLIKPDIVLNVQDAISLNFTLPIGAFHETITVEAGAPLVNSETSAVSTVVDQKYVANMPLNGRSLQDLILLTPGVTTNSPQTPASFTGQLTGAFLWLIHTPNWRNFFAIETESMLFSSYIPTSGGALKVLLIRWIANQTD